MRAELPTACDIGLKRNAKGFTSSWIGYKLHLPLGTGAVARSFSAGKVRPRPAPRPRIRAKAARRTTASIGLHGSLALNFGSAFDCPAGAGVSCM
jgi:hypothetical protein